MMNINLRGMFFLTQLFANAMIRLKDENIEDYTPRIVNISSMSSFTSSVNRGEYCISKAGISMVTMLFADKLAEYGIPVFEIQPGIIATDMTSGVKEKYDRLIAEGITPIKRWGYQGYCRCGIGLCQRKAGFCHRPGAASGWRIPYSSAVICLVCITNKIRGLGPVGTQTPLAFAGASAFFPFKKQCRVTNHQHRAGVMYQRSHHRTQHAGDG